MNEKKFSFLCITFLGSISLLFYIFSLYCDPYGLQDTRKKKVENLILSTSFLIKEKLEKKVPYYIIGTSRTRRIDPRLPQMYLNQQVFHLGFSGYTISPILILLQQIKKNGNNVIMGLDTFALNNEGDKLQIQTTQQLKRVMTSESNFPYYFSYDFLSNYISALFSRISIFDQYNNIQPKNNTYSEILDFSIKNNGAPYKDYVISQEIIDQIISLLTPKDIVIIFPKYYLYYKIFAKYPYSSKNIQQQYFQAIKRIVNESNAQVWSFYGINQITQEKNNFDDYGWHFKPKISPLIFARIFNDKNVKIPNDFGVLLTKENVDEELNKIEKQEKQYFQN